MKAVFVFLFALGAFGVFAAVLAVFRLGKYLGLDEVAVSTGLIVVTLVLASASLGLFVVSHWRRLDKQSNSRNATS